MERTDNDRHKGGENRRENLPIGEWWVDDCGSWRGGGYLNLLFPPESQESRCDGECAALFHLGMANIVLSPNRVHIRWSVQHVHPHSLLALREFLAGLIDSPRIVLEYFFGAWERRYFSDLNDAIDCLNLAMDYRDTVPMPKPFVRRMPMDDEDAAVPAIREVVAAWERASGRFSLTEQNAMSAFGQRLLVFSPNRRDDGLIYRFLGSQAALTRFKGSKWAAEVKGKTYDRGVDNISEGDNLTGPYGEVLRKVEPRLDHVRARITRRDQTPEWVTYQRLLLPATGDRGQPLVLCMAARTPKVNIPRPVQTASDK